MEKNGLILLHRKSDGTPVLIQLVNVVVISSMWDDDGNEYSEIYLIDKRVDVVEMIYDIRELIDRGEIL